MPPVSRFSLENLSLRSYMAVCFALIIIVVAGFLISISYYDIREELIAQNENLRVYGERYVIESVVLVDTGLRLYDNTLNEQMEEAFPAYLASYQASGGEIAKIDLDELKRSLEPGFSGTLDLYIIDESGVIVASTVPAVLGLDFRQFPDYFQAITRIREGDSFAVDRVVRSIPSTSEGTVTGTLRKFAYMPTPDHRYLLEIGLESDAFFKERTDLSYHGIAARLLGLNPNLVSVRIIDTNRVLVSDPTAPDAVRTDDPAIDLVLANRRGYATTDPTSDTTTSYLFADLKDPAAASDMSLVIELVYSGALLQEKLRHVLFLHVLIGSIAVGMGVVLAYGTSRLLTRPIKDIIEDVDTIARGDLDHPIRSMQNPEFTSLENSITTMIQRIRDYSQEIAREKAELQIAATIQLSFLPRTLPRVEGYDIAAASLPAREVGGDFYDLIDLGAGKTGFVIADVAGKGVPAALFMVLSRTTVRFSMQKTGGVSRAMADANRMISVDADQGMFVTLFFGILDPRSGVFRYANAGHNPPLHYHAATGEITQLRVTGMAIGVDSDQEYGEDAVTLRQGDILVFYTDGVVEAINTREEAFGEERLHDLIIRACNLPAAGLLQEMHHQVQEFAGGAPQFDDITLVVLKAG
ncbi:MAG: SpoIIE family protein phosphatase [Methanoregulaceae archaeon]|jgi:serine phosphatase RsbU (regulator of sigma subunit)